MGDREDPEPPDGEWTSEGFTSSDNKPLPSLTRRRASAAAPPAATGAAASCSDDDAADAAPPAPKGRLLRLPLLHRYAHPAPRPCATVARLRDALAEARDLPLSPQTGPSPFPTPALLSTISRGLELPLDSARAPTCASSRTISHCISRRSSASTAHASAG